MHPPNEIERLQMTLGRRPTLLVFHIVIQQQKHYYSDLKKELMSPFGNG